MSGAHCERFPACMAISDQPKAPSCDKADCPGKATWLDAFPLTEAQRDWLAARPEYCLCGRPRAGISFRECGTLYADGRFEPTTPMKPVLLELGCVLVGVPSDLYLTDRAQRDLTKMEAGK